MTSIHFVVHPLPGTDDQLNDSLREVADKLNRHGFTSPPAFSSLRNVFVSQCVVGPGHVALLLEDGRVCRMAFSVLNDRLDLNKTTETKVKIRKLEKLEQGAARSNTLVVESPLVLVSDVVGSGTTQSTGRWGGAGSTTTTSRSSSQQGYSRIQRAVHASRGRRSGVIVGTRPIVPASVVPEELINQCQVVLQGKSRNLIIRELQRTNLDVNLAVNNLLSRDDEGEDNDEDSQDSYINGGDDLMSLLDSGMHSDHPSVIIDADTMFGEDMFGYSSLRGRGSGSRSRTGERDREADRERVHESIFRIRDRRRLDSVLRDDTLRSLERETKGDNPSSENTKKGHQQTPSPLVFGDELQYWLERDGSYGRFTHIGTMHSDLVAVGTNGQLYSWRWADVEPYHNAENPSAHHPKTTQLGLGGEKIVGLSSCAVRASVFTESGKVATWVDDALNIVASKLEHSAQSFSEFQSERILSLHVCSLFTCARLESGALYWWGVMPFGQRKKLLEKSRCKKKKGKESGSHGDITAGTVVCLRSSPMYHAGALGFTIVNGVPKVGQLLTSAWSLNDNCTFKLKTSAVEPKSEPKTESKSTESKPDMPPPPSPASSTCSDHSGHSIMSPASLKRKKSTTPIKDLVEKTDEENWPLKDVVFVEDIKTMPVGKVLKVDGAYAAVKFQPKEVEATPTAGASSAPTLSGKDDPAYLLQECRLLRKDELLVVKGTSAPRVPDCFQKSPKKVPLAEGGQIQAVSVDCEGIHVLIRSGSKLSYMMHNLSTGKVEQDSTFPTHTHAFLGQSDHNIALYNCSSDQESPVLLRDGNCSIYPLAKDCVTGIRDPLWLDLPPVQCLSVGIHSLVTIGSNMKNKAAVILMAVEHQNLMPHILRCDLERVTSLLSSIDVDPSSASSQTMVENILKERCDGARNILHACAATCVPMSNKETETDDTSNTPVTTSSFSSTLDAINAVSSAVDALASIHGRNSDPSSRGVSLREMMQRATSAACAVSGLDGRESDREDSGIAIPTLNWPPDPPRYESLKSEGEGQPTPRPAPAMSSAGPSTLPDHSTFSMPPVKLEEKERRSNAVQILKLLCESAALKSHLLELLSARNAEGCTPFMQAVCGRAYNAGLTIFEAAKKLATKKGNEVDKVVFMSMIYPPGSTLDNSPLHMICCNDTCSFTWTGADHINQDIFECRTCGLLGTLCCCTECARVCHKGHDCKLKRTSPTAYCDCWEKCKCKALIAGKQGARFELLSQILTETGLVTLPNSRGENVLLFLVQTVGRQVSEQRQYRPPRSRLSAPRKTPVSDLVDVEMPEHNLEPPRFSRRALERILNDWTAVKAMILSGTKHKQASPDVVYEDQLYLDNQSGTARLDKFAHCLLFKCSVEMMDTLLTTLIREMQSDVPGRQEEAKMVSRRFVRSVARIFVVVSVEMQPIAGKKTSVPLCPPITKPKRVFQALINIAIEELCQIANALIAPVRMGVVRPTAPFSLVSISSEAVQGSEELFSADPLPPRPSSEVSAVTPDVVYVPPVISHRDVSQSEPVETARDEEEIITADVEEVEMVEAEGVDDDPMDQHSDHDDHQSEHSDQEPPPQEQDEAAAESDMDLDLLAESESDSESSHSQYANLPRTTNTQPTTASEAGMGSLAYFSEDSGESSNQEEDEEDTDGGDSEGRENMSFLLEQYERHSNTGSQGQRSLQAPQTMQWAIRQREQTNPRTQTTSGTTSASGLYSNPRTQAASTSRTNAANSTGSGLIYIDPLTHRRTALVSSTNQENAITMATTASQLARASSIVMRQIADLMSMTHEYHVLAPGLPRLLEITEQDTAELKNYLETNLKPVWEWLLTVMDSTEAQLRFGSALSNTTDQANPIHPMHSNYVRNLRERNNREEQQQQPAPTRNPPPTTTTTNALQVLESRRRTRFGAIASTDGNSARRDFLTYALSLMRSHNDEHSDSLPVIDISALRHVAYVFDALIYCLRSGPESADPESLQDGLSIRSWQDHEENENEEHDEDPVTNSVSMETDSMDGEADVPSKAGHKHAFFQRSDSTTFLGCPPPDPFSTPLVEALPLADQPHLLQPNSRREDLFGMPRQTFMTGKSEETTSYGTPTLTGPALELPMCLALAGRNPTKLTTQKLLNKDNYNPISTGTNVTDGPGETSVIVRPSAPSVPSTSQSNPPTQPPVEGGDSGVSQQKPLEDQQMNSTNVSQQSVIVHASTSAASSLSTPSSVQEPLVPVAMLTSSAPSQQALPGNSNTGNEPGHPPSGDAQLQEQTTEKSSTDAAPGPSSDSILQQNEGQVDLVGANENVSTTVVVETTQTGSTNENASGTVAETNQLGSGIGRSYFANMSHDLLLGRWRLTLDLLVVFSVMTSVQRRDPSLVNWADSLSRKASSDGRWRKSEILSRGT
ncbi:E3 ubiquitin-protein ligase UBR5-like isoform X2 [Liolophura sinensis]|uniref:E3 ubiquitin-protein ligase UBR5-like isoform X2 n=1 Tax=Liolophura sinensis TaxID=3198878 RepID=UPI00315848C7